MSDLESITIYNKMGKEYLNKIKNLFPIEIDDFIKILPKGGSVLDAGCAGGRDSAIFYDKGFNPTGIDLSEVLLEEAKKRYPKIDFRRMDFSELKFPPECFDGIWAHGVLQEIPKEELNRTLIGFFRVLKPTGKLHLRIEEGTGEVKEKDVVTGNEKRVIRYITKGEIRQLLMKTGFTIHITENITSDRGIKWLKVWAQK